MEKAESGLDRKKSHPAGLASLALFYFFRARRIQAESRVTTFISANNCHFRGRMFADAFLWLNRQSFSFLDDFGVESKIGDVLLFYATRDW